MENNLQFILLETTVIGHNCTLVSQTDFFRKPKVLEHKAYGLVDISHDTFMIKKKKSLVSPSVESLAYQSPIVLAIWPHSIGTPPKKKTPGRPTHQNAK